MLLGHPPSRGLFVLDLWTREFHVVEIPRRSDCPCSTGVLPDFERQEGGTTSLCGRDAIQVMPLREAEIDINALAERLGDSGETSVIGGVLRFKTGENEIILFRDGRAIVKGTEDEGRAKALYARYVGH